MLQNDFANASKSLDLGLSYNLSINGWPLYNLLSGLVHKHYQKNNECIQCLENSLNNLTSNIFKDYLSSTSVTKIITWYIFRWTHSRT